jgi:tetratricopeptide (TPR) repeat protein
VRHLLVMVGIVVATLPATALAQGGAPQRQEPYKNLKVLPKDISRDSLGAVMRNFTGSLGVRCSYCHAQKHGTNSPDSIDFTLDEKPEKEKARFMLRMVREINADLLADIPEPSVGLSVGCITCHRGSPLPQTIDAVLATTIDTANVETAVRQYRQLRQAAMENGRYDFSETPMNDLARRLAAAGKNAQAVTILEMNSEIHPNSAAIDVQLGDVYRTMGEREKAIVRYRLALEKQPNNQNARRRLDELTGAAPAAGQGAGGGQTGAGQRPAAPGGQQAPAGQAPR